MGPVRKRFKKIEYALFNSVAVKKGKSVGALSA